MRTQVFEQFLKQLNAQGYAKADGFDLNWYDRMSAPELKEAERLLLAQAHTGDMSPIPSLAKIATPEAVGFLKQTYEAKNYYPESGLDYELAKYLWDITHEEKYLRVFDKPALINVNKRLRLISILASLPDKSRRIKQLRNISQTDDDSINRFQAAKEILRLIGLIKEDSSNLEDFRPLLSKIASKDLKERNVGKIEIDNFIKVNNKT